MSVIRVTLKRFGALWLFLKQSPTRDSSAVLLPDPSD
jgi:hypothetical protein